MTTEPPQRPSGPAHSAGEPLEVQITAVGRQLGQTLAAVLESVPGEPHGPQKLATTLGLDKVLTSRAIRAAKHRDPIAVMQLAPGPDPMRRLIRAAKRHGSPQGVVDSALDAVEQFERLIREEAGDRGALGAILATWLPDARAEFEYRRKQAAYKARSLLKGAVAEVNLAAVVLHPAADGETIDVLWIMGLLGLRRLRPEVALKFVSRRVSGESKPRESVTLGGEPIAGTNSVTLSQFCDAPPASLEMHRAGDVTHYMITGADFGLKSRSDLIIAEANLAEMPRFVAPGSGRKGYVFAEVSTPSRVLVFDTFVHDAIYPGADPSLFIYDTAFDGVANVNDRARDVDRLDMMESIKGLGRGVSKARIAELPRHTELLESAFGAMGWSSAEFRGYRCRIDYPIYGSQVTMAFEAPSRGG